MSQASPDVFFFVAFFHPKAPETWNVWRSMRGKMPPLGPGTSFTRGGTPHMG